ncbi:hypothetical protein RB200_00160 [Streptomyces sp. PmtG]
MTSPRHLRPEDRADFEWVLNLALDVTDVRTALEQGPAGHDRQRLRAQAWAAAAGITAAAAPEYRVYLRARASVVPGPRAAEGTFPARPRPRSGLLLPSLAVLTPLLSAIAAVVFLLLGYGIQLVTPQSQLGASLVSAGWISAVLTAVSTAVGLSGLLTTALRHHTARSGRLTVRNPAAERARDAWQQALLERGMLPYLRGRLARAGTPGEFPG